MPTDSEFVGGNKLLFLMKSCLKVAFSILHMTVLEVLLETYFLVSDWQATLFCAKQVVLLEMNILRNFSGTNFEKFLFGIYVLVIYCV